MSQDACDHSNTAAIYQTCNRLYAEIDRLKQRNAELESKKLILDIGKNLIDRSYAEEKLELMAENDAMRPLVEALAEYELHTMFDGGRYICRYCKNTKHSMDFGGAKTFIHKPTCPVLLAQKMKKKWEEKGINI